MIHQLQYHLPVAFHFHYLISPSKSIHPPFFLWRAELQQSTVLRSPGVPSSHSTASSSLQCMSMVNIFLKIHAALVSFIGFLALLSEVKHLFFKGQYCSDQVRPHNCCNAQNWHFMRVFTQAPRQCLHCSPVCRKQPEIPHLFCLYMACFFLLSCSFPGFPGTAVQTRAIQSTQHSLPLETGGLALGIGISASTFLVCRCPAICRLIIFFNPGSALILRTFSALVSFFVSCEAFRKA